MARSGLHPAGTALPLLSRGEESAGTAAYAEGGPNDPKAERVHTLPRAAIQCSKKLIISEG